MSYDPFTVSFPTSSTPPTAFSPSFPVSETSPVAAPSERSDLADVTALKALASADLALGLVRTVTASATAEQREAWELTEGDDADDVSGGIARPGDYADTTNERVWRRRV